MKNPRPWYPSLQTLLSRCRALFSIVMLLAISGILRAQSPVGSIANIPSPNENANAYSTSLRYDSSGNLYAWDGISVWKLSGGTGNFNQIGLVASGYYSGSVNYADAGPISFSQDGKSLLLSNGAGGYRDCIGNGGFWTMSALGGTAANITVSGVPYVGDTVALPTASAIPGSGTKYIVNAGESTFSSSSVSIFDASTGSNQVVIQNGPGATTSIAFNPKDNSFYVGVGYGSSCGNIYSFSLSQIDSAYNSKTPIDFTSGKLFNPTATGSQIGSGMFFDKNGYLFSGGFGVTVFRPDGTISYDQPGGYVSLTYNPANNEVLQVPYPPSPSYNLYNAGEFESGAWTATSGTTGSWRKSDNWLNATVPTSGTAAATFAGTLGTPIWVTLDGNQSAGPLVFDVFGTNGFTLSQGTGGGALTLGTSAGASITVVSGTHTISAPVVLAGSLAVSMSKGGSLRLGNVSQTTGGAAAINLSGDGQLILSGTDNYTASSLTVSGGTLDLGTFTATTTNSVSFQGGLTENGVIVNNGTAYDGQAGQVSASLRGTAGLTKTGAGTLILSGTNDYRGGTTVAEGTLELLGSSALPEGTALTIGSGAKLIFGGSFQAAPMASSISVAVVPEPGTLGLLAAGAVCFVAARSLRRKRLE